MTDCCSVQRSGLSKSENLNDEFQMSSAVPWPHFPMESRVRVLRMLRPFPTCRSNMFSTSSNLSFGFTVRGGKEHGTGFFVSHVEKNSEADLKGLQLGDQILWVNQFRIDNATHKEFVQIISSQDCITLKVRNTGILPIKDKNRDFLYWYEITEREEAPEANNDSTIGDAKSLNDITVFLHVEPGSKLGLGICKGPSWKPGIFVLFTKENSLAHKAGLRPGDQILSVNSILFADVLFSEAVAVMKSSHKLKMLVRTASASKFVAGSTSGYNNSSADGSIIYNEGSSKRNFNTSHVESTNTCNSPCVDLKKEFNKTVIELVGNSKQDNNNNITMNYSINSVSNRNCKLTAPVSKHEGHLKNLEDKTAPNVPEAPTCSTLKVETNNNRNNNFISTKAGLGYNSSLSSAITQEIQKRKEKFNKNTTDSMKLENQNKSATELRETSNIAATSAQTTVTKINEKVENYRSALVDEFKRVHHRMVLKIKDNGQME